MITFESIRYPFYMVEGKKDKDIWWRGTGRIFYNTDDAMTWIIMHSKSCFLYRVVKYFHKDKCQEVFRLVYDEDLKIWVKDNNPYFPIEDL